MILFLSICLYLFAAITAGLVPAAFFTARKGRRAAALAELLAAAFAVFVLVSAAGDLR